MIACFEGHLEIVKYLIEHPLAPFVDIYATDLVRYFRNEIQILF